MLIVKVTAFSQRNKIQKNLTVIYNVTSIQSITFGGGIEGKLVMFTLDLSYQNQQQVNVWLIFALKIPIFKL